MAFLNEQVPYFGEGNKLSCSESTLRLLIERGVVDLPLSTVQLMSGLHGGIFGHGRGAMCGALNGGAVALASVLGRTAPGESNARLGAAMKRFVDAFEGRFHAVSCDDLLIYEDESDEQLDLCAKQILFAADLVEQILAEEKAKGL